MKTSAGVRRMKLQSKAVTAAMIRLLVSEAGILTFAGVIVGVVATYALLFALRPAIDAAFGLYLDIAAPTGFELAALAVIVTGGLLAGLVSALRAYQHSLADGMPVRN